MALALVLTLGFLTPWRADGQRSPHLGTVTAEGRVTYYANGAVSTTDWIVGISARQHLHDGRWDSFALDVVWDAGSWRGGALGTRVFGRYDRLKDHSRAFPGVEVWWRASRRVTVTMEVTRPGGFVLFHASEPPDLARVGDESRSTSRPA
jgi:hypothetical protein